MFRLGNVVSLGTAGLVGQVREKLLARRLLREMFVLGITKGAEEITSFGKIEMGDR